MIVKEIIQERFTDYYKPHLFIATPSCDWKCWKETDQLQPNFCINCHVASLPDIDVPDQDIIDMFISNEITESIVIGGLEPFDTFSDVDNFINDFRKLSNADIVIYTGYDYWEITETVDFLKKYKNIIIKYGRYKENSTPVFDPVLKISLISNNQYAVRIS